MLENGMIIGAEAYDPQYREVASGRCCVCREQIPVSELTEFASGDRVCRDCMAAYLCTQGADFVPEYIAEHLEEYLKDWWFAGLSPREQLEALKAGYLAANLTETEHEYLAQDRVNFCKEDDGFAEFVRGRLL